ncbi:N-acetylmuramoyl-L-alanine amidase [Streptomyces sp. TLI_146]|uniref:N-acetylmuramoyl-L-alanine amidase n=1 Tax=Streptomyces sp. TLI_146 TaxID=1938858 RepID=UPI000C70737C|nr:N-acetylmuramoyl-L-alanine amidase [Streptomyces sp. TLI_146]
MKRSHRRDRKKKLIAYGVGAAVVATAAIGTLAVASPGPATTDGKPAAPGSALQARFADAAREFHVPQSVLMAVSYRQTLWESHAGQPSTTGAYNVMGLTRVTADDVEQPTDAERLSHLNMSGDPTVMKHFDAKRALKRAPKAVDTSDPRLHTLDEAAKLIDKSVDAVRKDENQSVRAGAALLAKYQKDATGSLPEDAGKWYAAVARYSQAPDTKGASLFAKRVYESIRTGESRVTADGQQLALPADPSVKPVRPETMSLAAFNATTQTPECPAGLNCDFRPAAYQQNSSTPDDFGNYNESNRPANGEDIRYLVIHDTEGGYDGSLKTFQTSTSYASAHYMVRASDGLVTQLVATKDEAWHAANKTMNMHSIGIEHEGYAIKDNATWYTEPQYESSAALVKYLANRFSIPLDREHIVGHDEVPGVLDTNVKSQHWDPGPYWDWNHYMTLVGAPTGDQGAGGPLKAGQLVRVVPPFTTANQPTVTYGGNTYSRPANFGYLYTSPSTSGAALGDPYLGTQTASEGPNWGNKVVAGGEYVVAEAQTNWTAIWYGGQKAWFYNPGGTFTAPVGKAGQPVLKPKAGATSIPVYGRAYPEDSAYAGTNVPVQSNNSASLTKYSIPAGQAYTQAGPAQNGDYWFAGTFAGTATGDRTLVQGKTNSFYPIRYNHRLAWVKATDVEQATSTTPDPGTTRYNLLGRDSSGGLWQYQGTGSASAPFYGRYRIGGGWQGYNAVSAMTALRADGTGDMVARDGTGTLWYYQGSGNPNAPFKSRLKVGGGWQTYNFITGARDLNGDGKADLIGRDGTGVLWYYQGTGNPAAPFAARVKIGGGWQGYNAMVSTGDLNRDGKADLVARDGSGVLWFYKGTGTPTAPYAPRVQIGGGWQGYNSLLGPSDLNGDGIPDLVARDGSGVLWYYKGTGSATGAPFATRVQVGGGWQMFNLLV